MTSSAKLLCFLLLIPFLLAAGFDIYVNYKKADGAMPTSIEEINLATFQPSDLGYLIVTYQPELYDALKMSFAEETWAKWINPILASNTYIVALAPLALFCIWLLIARILQVWPFTEAPVIGRQLFGIRAVRDTHNPKIRYKRR